MNRRQFLLGAAATPVALALPLPSQVNRYSVRTGLPTIVWRRINDGVPITQVEAIDELVAYGRTHYTIEDNLWWLNSGKPNEQV